MRIDGQRLVVAILVVAGLGGCAIGRNPEYPGEWAKPEATTRVGSCPLIAGVYRAQGQLALESGVDCRSPYRSKTGEWQCSMDLSNNLGLSDDAAIVELRQPAEDTLEVLLRAESGAPVATHTLKKGTEFSCDAESLYFSGTASAAPGALAVVGAMLLTGGVVNHTRSFERDRDGELVMTVRGRMLFFYLGLPLFFDGTSHVRWFPATPPAGDQK